MLIMTGSVYQQDGVSPDAGIFAIPLFYAFIAALIAWYLPMRSKKKKPTSVKNKSPDN